MQVEKQGAALLSAATQVDAGAELAGRCGFLPPPVNRMNVEGLTYSVPLCGWQC